MPSATLITVSAERSAGRTPAWARTGSPGLRADLPTLTGPNIDLTVGHTPFTVGSRTGHAVTINGVLPAPLLRLREGQNVRLSVANTLDEDTSIHWHGIRLRNAADGVPGQTQDPIAAGSRYVYEFTAPDPGTYFFHPHVGVQLDRGLYAPMVIDDPDEPGRYDAEWILVLDDWIDGTGTSPDEVLKKLVADGGPANGPMGGMDHGSGGMDMEGMSEEDMTALDSSSGAEFDRMFLDMMIPHHQGAVEMAETEIADGSDQDAVEMAREIVESQTAEIQEMQTLLTELGG